MRLPNEEVAVIDVVWLDQRALLLLHEKSLATHGGLRGRVADGLLESALARPLQIVNYRSDATLAELAAAYAVGITRNHPFSDGNKRAAFLAMTLFCRQNGWRVVAPDLEAIALILSLASGELTEEQLAVWIEQHLKPVSQQP